MFVLSVSVAKREFDWPNLAAFVLAATATPALLISAITAGHPIALEGYNFIDVPKDQWWYFGPYRESFRILRFADLSRLATGEIIFSLLVLLLTGACFLRTRMIQHALLTWIGAALFAGGFVASIGGHLIPGYFVGLLLWAQATAIVASLWLATWCFDRLARPTKGLRVVCGVTAVVVALLTAFYCCSRSNAALTSARNDKNRFYVAELGGYLRNEWKDYVGLMRTWQGGQVIEEYWGLWGALRRTFAPWPVDSVIHALGRTRNRAKEALATADTIVSTRTDLSAKWQSWSVSQNFWFYDELLKNWSPYAVSPTTVVWHKNATSRTGSRAPCKVGVKGRDVTIFNAEPGFFRLDIEYVSRGTSRYLLLMRNNMSFGADANGYVSLDPGGREATVPAYLEGRGSTTIDAAIVGAADLKILSCAASEIAYSNSDVLSVPGTVNDRFFLTDGNWVHGIGRSFAGFFLPNVSRFVDQYRPGRIVTVNNGEQRKIVRVQPAGHYLNVFLEGQPLDPDTAGLPSGFTVSDMP